ncbi:MAG: Uma2 family endonuclease [Gemmataceae bacterium]|nr:Uma2 family endonuclease [Gemmataceae bacterium]
MSSLLSESRPFEMPDAVPRTVVYPLEHGDRLTRDEFERRYHAMPGVKKAELIEGVVYMPFPVRQPAHSGPHSRLVTFLGIYAGFTPGVESGDNGTVRLDLDNEPQPDAFLYLAHGGQAKLDDDEYVSGAPELVAEVAASSASYDLHAKLNVYRRNKVREYFVWRVLDGEIDWFALQGSKYEKLPLVNGVIQSEVFPGLWLNLTSFLKADFPAVFNTLQQGLATAEHREFKAKIHRP